MKTIVIKRLFDSFRDLERAIASAKQTLEEREDTPIEVIKRIETYEEILLKQKNLATALCGHASLGNWEQVSRHIKLISGLSAMIRDDAREILKTPRKIHSTEERDVMFC